MLVTGVSDWDQEIIIPWGQPDRGGQTREQGQALALPPRGEPIGAGLKPAASEPLWGACAAAASPN